MYFPFFISTRSLTKEDIQSRLELIDELIYISFKVKIVMIERVSFYLNEENGKLSYEK